MIFLALYFPTWRAISEPRPSGARLQGQCWPGHWGGGGGGADHLHVRRHILRGPEYHLPPHLVLAARRAAAGGALPLRGRRGELRVRILRILGILRIPAETGPGAPGTQQTAQTGLWWGEVFRDIHWGGRTHLDNVITLIHSTVMLASNMVTQRMKMKGLCRVQWVNTLSLHLKYFYWDWKWPLWDLCRKDNMRWLCHVGDI